MGDTGPSARFAGKVALVTGAASGIGRATALRLAGEGAAVLAHDVDAAGLDATASAGQEAGGTIRTRAGDLSARAECVAAVAECVDAFGRLDVLGNVAGISSCDHFCDVAEQSYRRMMAVNVDAYFFTCQAAIPHLLDAGGNIVNLASSAGLNGNAYTVAYCMTKGAVIQLTRSLAMEFWKTPLRINAIAPGAVETSLVANFRIPDDVDWDLVGRYMSPRPMGSADDVAALFAFVASDDGRNIHGAVLSTDAGLSAG